MRQVPRAWPRAWLTKRPRWFPRFLLSSVARPDEPGRPRGAGRAEVGRVPPAETLLPLRQNPTHKNCEGHKDVSSGTY